MTTTRHIIRFPKGRYGITGWLVGGSVLALLAGIGLLSGGSTVSFGLIGLACVLAIFARMAQAQVHHKESLMLAGWVDPESEEAGEA